MPGENVHSNEANSETNGGESYGRYWVAAKRASALVNRPLRGGISSGFQGDLFIYARASPPPGGRPSGTEVEWRSPGSLTRASA